MVVVGAVVVGSTDVVVSSTTEVDASAAVPAALLVRRMAGSLLRWGMPAMATPTAAHTTSMTTVTERCPGLTAPPLTPLTVTAPTGEGVEDAGEAVGKAARRLRHHDTHRTRWIRLRQHARRDEQRKKKQATVHAR